MFKMPTKLDLCVGSLRRRWLIPWNLVVFLAAATSQTLLQDIDGEHRRNTNTRYKELRGDIHRVRMVLVSKGPKKIKTLFYYGKTVLLDWDPSRFEWHESGQSTLLIEYIPQLGRNLLKEKTHNSEPCSEQVAMGTLL